MQPYKEPPQNNLSQFIQAAGGFVKHHSWLTQWGAREMKTSEQRPVTHAKVFKYIMKLVEECKNAPAIGKVKACRNGLEESYWDNWTDLEPEIGAQIGNYGNP